MAPLTSPEGPDVWVAEQIEDAGCLWSLGAPGACGTFSHGRTAAETTADARSIVARSAEAAIRVERLPGLRLVAFETISSDPFMWNHGVAICIAEDDLPGETADVIADIGSDDGAIHPFDRIVRCFDIGIASRQTRVLIRSADMNVSETLSRFVGEIFFQLPQTALEALAASKLDWVFETPAGRLEVRQQAGDAKADSYPPFIDRRMLASGLTHARGIPVPAGLVPCGYVFPPHPARLAPGRAKGFDGVEHERFQATLDRFGVPELVKLKRMVEAALGEGAAPPLATSYHERQTVRVALRQWRKRHPEADLGPWLLAFDRPLLAALEARRK